jgi:hypothetical protein
MKLLGVFGKARYRPVDYDPAEIDDELKLLRE